MQKRNAYIDSFQNGDTPYMVLSLKTAGVGLNLTAAQNVIHFDRWWNPAVENQATDRVYRNKQKKNVTVYRFTSANTVEENINKKMSIKQHLADEIINDIDSNMESFHNASRRLAIHAQYAQFIERKRKFMQQ